MFRPHWIAQLILGVVPTTAYAQGCIVAQSSQQFSGPEGQGGYLMPGEVETSLSYRHQCSFRHFVGSTEQTYRIQQGTQVMNKINLQTFTIAYQITPRWSVSGDAPVLLASRRSNNSPFATVGEGLGDVSVSGQAWLFSPRARSRGNVSLGLGVVFPTGKAGVRYRVDQFDGKGPQDVLLDYSVRPGSGGWGIAFKWQSFLQLGSRSVAYFNGSYIATPQNTNTVLRGTPGSLTAYNSISDMYLLGWYRPVDLARAWPFSYRRPEVRRGTGSILSERATIPTAWIRSLV
jgi:hypothetical protein